MSWKKQNKESAVLYFTPDLYPAPVLKGKHVDAPL